VEALNQIGGFREDLFIDYVDYDVCLRLRASGWKVAVEPAAVLRHTIGAQTPHRLLWLVPVDSSNHSPDRQYYKYRNYVLLARDRTLQVDLRSMVLDAAALLWQPVKIMLFERDRRQKLRAMGQGVTDGIRGRTGVRPVR
jgi:rhamnosyltransferase